VARTWNAQGLFAARPDRHRRKKAKSLQLMKGAQILATQETHGTPGKAKALSLPAEVRPFWSHLTSQLGGVGLWFARPFLQNFDPLTDDDIIQVEAGRAMVVRLEGPLGALDVINVYLHTGDAKAERAATMRALARLIRPPDRALTIILGDWNFVRESSDRFNVQAEEWSGEADTAEHRLFDLHLFSKAGLYEVEQSDMTHKSALGVSRLDRAYVNAHLADLTFRPWSTAAMAWP
jgi:exonuclease III